MQYASLAWRVMDGPAHMFEIPSSLADGLMSGMVADTLDGSVGITTTRLRTFRLRHFVYRHFVYRYFVYCDYPSSNRSWSDETNIISIEPGLMQGSLPN